MSMEKVRELPLEEEYGKRTGITRDDIGKLREWMRGQPHLPAEQITDLDLILAFHCCGCSAEVAKQLLDLNFTLRTLFANIFKDRLYDGKIQFALEKIALLTPLPTRSPQGYAAFYTRFLERDAKHFVFVDIVRALLMRLELWQLEEGTWPGLLLLVDLEGMALGHLAKLDMQTVQQILYYLQEALLVNLKGMHFLNAPSFMDRLMLLIRPFLSKSMMQMLHIHQSGARTLDRFFPVEELPTGAGGQSKSLEQLTKENLSKMAAGKEYFVEENKKRVVEAKRPGRPKTITDIFGGVEGSFKKLDID